MRNHKTNREIVLEAARMHETAVIKHAAPEQKANREIVLEANSERLPEVKLSQTDRWRFRKEWGFSSFRDRAQSRSCARRV